MRPIHTVLAPLLLLAALAARGQPSAGSEELHALVHDGQYAQALQKISAALALRGPAAKSVDRYDLFTLKAECHLRTKALSLASESYANAFKEATDDRQRALTAAHQALLKASRAFAYTPKTSATKTPAEKTKPTPLDILDPAARKQAFAALLADELAAADAKLKAARAAKSLPPIAELIKPLTAMEGLELAATGESEKITALRQALTEQSKKVLADALRQLSKRLGEIDKTANTFVEFYQEVLVPSPTGLPQPRKEKAYKKRGLSDEQFKELQQTNATADQLPPALTELAAGLHQSEDAFTPFTDEAARIRKEVDRLLDTDYLRVYRELPKK